MSATFDVGPQSTTAASITPTTDTTLLSDLCPFCNESPPKYRCPACDARTCSLKCSKRHKVYKQCPGTRDPTAYVKRSKLTTPTALNRDFNFLTGVERAVTRVYEIPTDESDGQSAPARNAEQRKKQAAQARETWIEKSGVIVKRAPQGIKRSRENKTDVVKTKKARLLYWTVEWILCDEGNKSILDDRVMETSRLTSVFFHPNNSESRKKPKTEMAKTRFYLKKVGTPANRPTLIPLNPAAELRDSIRGRTVDEYPTIYVTAKSEHPEGFEIDQSIGADARGKLQVLEETSKGEAVVNMEKLEGSKWDIIAGGAEIRVLGGQEDGGSRDETTQKSEHLACPVSGDSVVGRADDRAQEMLVESALLELIEANGINAEVAEGLSEKADGDGGVATPGVEASGIASGRGTNDA